MSKLILNPEFRLYERDAQALYSSRQVAEEFGKRHDNVLQSIDTIADLKNQVSSESKNGMSEEIERVLAGQTVEQFFRENFSEHQYKDSSGKRAREVMMTRKGAMLIVMGFTGRKATAIKIGLLNRFEAMESFIRSVITAKLEHPAFTDAIQASRELQGKDVAFHHFSNEADMINRIVLGMSAKQYREAHGIAKGESIRPHLSTAQIKAVEALQRADIGLLTALLDFEQRKAALTGYYERMRLKQIA